MVPVAWMRCTILGVLIVFMRIYELIFQGKF